MEVIWAVVGVVGFEALRVYKRVIAGAEPFPKWKLVYLFCVLAVASFASMFVLAAGIASPIQSLFVGFSIPANAKVVFGRDDIKRLTVNLDETQVKIGADTRSAALSAGGQLRRRLKEFWSM